MAWMGYSVIHGWWFHIFEATSSVMGASLREALNDTGVIEYFRNHRNAILQYDGASTHNILKRNTKAGSLKWPPKSPDLNPIETIWGMMEYYQKKYNQSSKSRRVEPSFEGCFAMSEG